MENPSFHLRNYLLSALLSLLAIAGFSQTAILTIDYDPVVCIENNDDQCRTFVNILVNTTNFCSGVEVSHNSPLTTGENPSGIYFAGSYSFEVTARDTCGNEVKETVAFEVVDCRAPAAICRYGYVLKLDADCTAELQADDLNLNSEDNCTDRVDLEFRIARVDEDGQYYARGQSISFGKQDEGNQRVAIFVKDLEGNESRCETVVQIQCGDCSATCRDTTEELQLSGEFVTINGYQMEDVELYGGGNLLGIFDSPYNYMGSIVDTMNGVYFLAAKLCAQKNDDIINGVSTMDLLMIRRMIIGLGEFNGVQSIAADVNNDENISVRDMLEIRRVILRQSRSFQSVPSWLMFPYDFDFSELDSNPWSNPIDFDANCFGPYIFNFGQIDYSFIGLKMGDVTGDAGANWARSGDPIGFMTENKALNAGSVIELPFHTNTMDLLGYQMTLEFDADALELLSWSGELEDYNINTAQAEQGLLAISRVAEGSRSNQRFSLKFAVKENVVLSEVLWLSDAITRTEGYTDLESRRPIRLVFDEHDSEIGLTAYPNPFVDNVALEFNINDSGDYQLELFNAQGQRVYSQGWSIVSGKNLQILRKEELNVVAGWHLARVSGPNGVFTHSIIVK